MAMTRAQLRQQALAAAYKSEENKPPTRKEVQRWLEPVRKAVTMLLQGEYFEYEGYLLMPVPWAKEKTMGRLSEGILGLCSFLNRLDYKGESVKLSAIAYWKPTTDFCVECCLGALSELKEIENFIMTQPRKHLVETGRTEQIAILMELQK